MLCNIGSRGLYLTTIFFLIFVSCKTPTPQIKEYKHSSNIETKQETTNENLTRIYYLKKYQDFDFEERFKDKVENIYQKTYQEYQALFTYTLIPSGAIYSFSEVTINCIPDKKSSKAIKACSSFLNSLDEYYNTLKARELK